MALERSWAAVSTFFALNGDQSGLITVQSAKDFYVKQLVTIQSNIIQPKQVEIKRVEGRNRIYVGEKGNIRDRMDVSAYLVSDSAELIAYEQAKSLLKDEDRKNVVHENEPINATRVISVDPTGQKYDSSQRDDGSTQLMVDAAINRNNVSLFSKPYDAITAEYPSAIQEIYRSRIGGVSGTIIESVTVIYTDTTKDFITSAVRT